MSKQMGIEMLTESDYPPSAQTSEFSLWHDTVSELSWPFEEDMVASTRLPGPHERIYLA